MELIGAVWRSPPFTQCQHAFFVDPPFRAEEARLFWPADIRQNKYQLSPALQWLSAGFCLCFSLHLDFSQMAAV
jgi:hypothetical protein